MATHYRGIEGVFDFDDVYDLALRRCGSRAARFCQLGAFKGRSACYAAERIRETGANVRFDLVDRFEGDGLDGDRDRWPAFAAALERAGAGDIVRVHRATGMDAAVEIADGSLDLLFLHAAPEGDTVARDLALGWPKVRPGGLLAGHGYARSERIAAAVDEFVAAEDLRHAFRTCGGSWLVYKSIAIDAAYCVNLPSRTDRRLASTKQFRAAGIEDRVTFFDAVDGRALPEPWALSPGQAGCALSHLRAMHEAARRGARHVLMFEDDVALVPDFAARLEAAFARCPASYDLCYVGALCLREWGNFLHPMDDYLARVGSVFGTHAYVVNLERLPVIDAALRDLRRVIDEFFVQDIHPTSNAYACVPYLAAQTPGFSDVAGAPNDNARISAGYVWR